MIRLRTLGGVEIEAGNAGDAPPVSLQSKQLALLALLIVSSDGDAQRRDTLVGLLWPERDQRGARHALSQALYGLRRALGDDIIVNEGSEKVRVSRVHVWCDAVAFREALVADRPDEAVSLYGGEFMPGFYIREAEVFDQWLTTTREALARQYGAALRSLAEDAEAAGDYERAADRWGQISAHDPYDSAAVLKHMRTLEASGRRGAAIERAEEHAVFLAEELGAEPDPDIAALGSRLRDTPEASGLSSHLAASNSVWSAPSDHSWEMSDRRRRWLIPAAAGFTTVGALILLAGVLARSGEEPVPSDASAMAAPLDAHRVLVAPFENRTGDPTLDRLGLMAADWVTQGLTETGLVSVVPGTMELWSPTDAKELTFSVEAATQAARETGSAILVDGAYYRQGDSLAFQARIIDVASGQVARWIGDVTAEEPTVGVEMLRRRVTGALATMVDQRLVTWSTVTSQPPSFEAYQKYADALTLFLSPGASEESFELFLEAAAMDSTFNMPLIWATFATGDEGRDSVLTVLERRRDRLPPFERAMSDYVTAVFRTDDFHAAYQAARRAVEIAPNSEWNYKLAWAALGINRPREALEVLLRVNPGRGWLRDWPAYWDMRAYSRHLLGDYEGELRDARLMRKAFPDHPAHTMHTISALIGLGRADEALAWMSSQFMQLPNRQCEPSQMAWEFRVHGFPDHALRAADLALRLYQESRAEESCRIADIILIRHLKGEMGEAYRLARSEAEKNPEDPNSVIFLGVYAAAAGDRDAAMRAEWHLREMAVDDSTLSWSTLLGRAAIAAHLGERERAVELLRQASELQHFWDLHLHPAFEPLWDYEPYQRLMKPKG